MFMVTGKELAVQIEKLVNFKTPPAVMGLIMKAAEVLKEVDKLRAERDAAYYELHKLWGGHHVLFDCDVYNAVHAWWRQNEMKNL